MINCIFCTFDCLHSLKIRTIQKKLILTTIRKHLKHWCFHYWHKSTNDQSLLIKVNHFLFLTSKSKVDFQSYKTPKVDISKTAIQSYWCHKLEDPAISLEWKILGFPRRWNFFLFIPLETWRFVLPVTWFSWTISEVTAVSVRGPVVGLINVTEHRYSFSSKCCTAFTLSTTRKVLGPVEVISSNSDLSFKFIADAEVVKKFFPPPIGENVAIFSYSLDPDILACHAIKPLYTESSGPSVYWQVKSTDDPTVDLIDAEVWTVSLCPPSLILCSSCTKHAF